MKDVFPYPIVCHSFEGVWVFGFPHLNRQHIKQLCSIVGRNKKFVKEEPEEDSDGMLDDEIDENDENAIEEFIGKFCCIFCLYTMICEKNKYDF